MSAAAFLPERIGRFRIHSMLGRGAMGVVYLGHDEEIDRLVAIKLIRADLLATDERDSYLNRFRNEAKIAGRCLHANIVGLYDFAMHDDNPYLVMEYVNGVGLQQFYPRGTQRPAAEVTHIALQVLDALHYAHGRSIVHRDIKPANILMMSDTSLKIADFGISRLTSMELTATPLLIGTPAYMSPEQCLGSVLDGRNDLFSLGCVLYELAAGERAFSGASYTETIFSIVNKPHVPLGERRTDLPPGFGTAIDRALSKSPEDRYPNAADFARTLDDIARAADLPRTRFPAAIASNRAAGAPVADRDGAVPDEEAAPATVVTPLAEAWGEPLAAEPKPPTFPAVDKVTTPTPADLGPGDPDTADVRPSARPATAAPARQVPSFPASLTAAPAIAVPAMSARPISPPTGAEVVEPDQDATVIQSRQAPAFDPAIESTHAEPFPTHAFAITPVPVAGISANGTGAADSPTEHIASPSFAPEAAAVAEPERERIASCLAAVIGPIAPLLVRRTMSPGITAAALTAKLAEFVHHPGERTRFLDLVRVGVRDREAAPK